MTQEELDHIGLLEDRLLALELRLKRTELEMANALENLQSQINVLVKRAGLWKDD